MALAAGHGPGVGGGDAPPAVELLTPHGAGGVAVLVLRGADAQARAAAHLHDPRSGRPLAPAACVVPRLAELRTGGELLDQVLVVARPARGEVELHLHGSPAVLAAVEAVLGPFPRGAGSAATAADRLLGAAISAPQLALALEQRSLAAPFAAFLTACDELPPDERRRRLRAAWRRSRAALALAGPARLVLCGARNAGKSTLMNRLLWSERVLTGPEAGLTRDPVEELVALAGYPYLLVDTAGELEESPPPGTAPAALDDAFALEREAIRRGRRARAGALLLLVVDGAAGYRPIDAALAPHALLVVRNKCDLPPGPWPAAAPAALAISCRDPGAAPELRALLGEALRRARRLPPAGPVGGPAALDRDELTALRAALRR